jgi:hypothetical protein
VPRDEFDASARVPWRATPLKPILRDGPVTGMERAFLAA